MYDNRIKSQFAFLRSAGITITRISEVMGINRTTLIQWNKELYADIKIAEHDTLENILAQNSVEKQKRVEVLARALKKAYDMLEKGFTGFNSGDVLRDIEKLTKLLNIEMEEKKYSSLVTKASKGMRTDFPIIIDDEEKYAEFDPDYVSPYDFEEDPLNKYSEEEKEELRKVKNEHDKRIAIDALELREVEELDMMSDANEVCANVSDNEFENEIDNDNCGSNKKSNNTKPAKRILNKKLNRKLIPDEYDDENENENADEVLT